MHKVAAVTLLAAVSGAAQTVTGVANVADLRNATLAPGVRFAIFGTNLGPAQNFRVAPPHPTTVGPYSALVRGADGLDRPLLLVSLQASVAVAILPSSVPEGDYDLIYAAGTGRSRAFAVKVAKRSFSAFTQSGEGIGPVLATVAGRAPTFTSPVQPGQLITLYGTGLGASPGSDAQANAQPLEVEIEIKAGQKTLRASAAGRSSQGAGVDEVQFTLPGDPEVGDGCYLPLRFLVDGSWSNVVTLAKSNDGAPCRHPLGVGETVLRKIDAGQGLVLGNYNLVRRIADVEIPGRQEVLKSFFVLGRFYFGDAGDLMNNNYRWELSGLADDECRVDTWTQNNPGSNSPDDFVLAALGRPVFPEASPLDGGTRAVVTTPTTFAIPLGLISSDGTLAGSLDESDPIHAASLVAGEWQLSWAGGSQLAAGRATLKVDETELLAAGPLPAVIQAGEELPLTWTPKGDSGATRASLFALFVAPGDTAGTLAFGSFSCNPTGRAFTVPAGVLARMPKTDSGRALLVLTARGAAERFFADYRNGLGQSDYAAFSQEASLLRIREYRR